jgi:hypothetical protein
MAPMSCTVTHYGVRRVTWYGAHNGDGGFRGKHLGNGVQEKVDQLVHPLPLSPSSAQERFDDTVKAFADCGGVIVAMVDVLAQALCPHPCRVQACWLSSSRLDLKSRSSCTSSIDLTAGRSDRT